jgi:hypothetical protein
VALSELGPPAGATLYVPPVASELFFGRGGSIEVLAGDHVLSATNRELVVVPPGDAHAFAASADQCVDALVMVTLGTERVELFRAMALAMAPGAGPAEPVIVLRRQNDADTHSAECETWSNR